MGKRRAAVHFTTIHVNLTAPIRHKESRIFAKFVLVLTTSSILGLKILELLCFRLRFFCSKDSGAKFSGFSRNGPLDLCTNRAPPFFFVVVVCLFFFSTEEKDGIQNMIKSNREKNARAIEDQSTGLFSITRKPMT